MPLPHPELYHRRVDLPLSEKHWETATAVGMQLCLNEGHDVVGALPSLSALHLSNAAACASLLTADKTDAIIVAGGR